jgi:HrpA-like RNA helicase
MDIRVGVVGLNEYYIFMGAIDHLRYSQCFSVTQPRRVGAMTFAQCVVQEHGCDLGTKVGIAFGLLIS